MTELDFSSLWSWTIPLWSLFLIVLFLAGLLGKTVTLRAIPGLPFAASSSSAASAASAAAAAPA
uniref:Uncharacterized protein n=1 Tax=viral metagenome TaxID=1070528 RepID=A0A6C0DBV4_9ZZZZ